MHEIKKESFRDNKSKSLLSLLIVLSYETSWLSHRIRISERERGKIRSIDVPIIRTNNTENPAHCCYVHIGENFSKVHVTRDTRLFYDVTAV